MNHEKSAKRYSGMTLNERLLDAGLLATFDHAVQAADRAGMLEILVKVEIESETATRTVDSILAHPTRFGRI